MKSKESNYIRLFKRELCLPCRQKNEILRDLRSYAEFRSTLPPKI